MKLVFGLGNPGIKYRNTPHNIGFEALEELARKNAFPDFSSSKKTHSLFSKKENIILIKPQTFMNKSGLAAKEAMNFWQGDQMIVVHDDIDLPFGRIKVSENRGSAGHKGVESIIQETGNKEFVRIRIGVSPGRKIDDPEKFVLQKFSRGQETKDVVIEKSVNALEDILKKGTEKAMAKYN